MKADVLAREIKDGKYDRCLVNPIWKGTTLEHEKTICFPATMRDDLVSMLFELNKRRKVMSRQGGLTNSPKNTATNWHKID